MLKGETTNTLIERQNEMIAAHNQALIERLIAFEYNMHTDNLVANEHLRYMAENFRDFVEVAQEFAENELGFSESVDNFSNQVKLFKEEFSNLERIHAEHIQTIHEEHMSNILHTTQKLDELHGNFYKDARRFTKESLDMLDGLLEKTVGNVHNEYTSEARKICEVISKIDSTLSKIENNVTKVNEEFTAEQQRFKESWQIFSKNLQTTVTDLTSIQEKFSATFKTIADEQNVANNIHLSELSAQSQAMVNTAKTLQENISKLTLNNEVSTEKLRVELVAVKNALESLNVALSEKGDKSKPVVERSPALPKKNLPLVSLKKSEKKEPVNFDKTNTALDRRDKR